MALNYAVNDSNATTNLKVWLPLNEYSAGSGAVNRYDAHNLANFTDSGTTPSATGNWNRCANFQRANSEAIYSNNSNLNLTSDFSFSVWVNFTTITSGQLRPFFGKDGGATTRSYASWLYNSGGTHQLRMFISSNGTNGEELVVTPSTGNFSTGTWYHIVGTWDASTSTAEFFVNGSSVGTATGTYTAIYNASANFYVGRFGNYSGDYTDAKMQDFALYDAVIDSTTISALYNSGSGMTYGVDYDTGTGNYNNSLTLGTSLTWSHTITGDNPVAYVAVMSDGTGSVSDVTFGGQTMTLVDEYTGLGWARPFEEAELYVIDSPSSGANTVSVNTTGSGSVACYGKSSSYIGVKQSGQPPHDNKNQATNTTLTTSIDTSTSPSTDNCWVIGCGFTDGNYTQSAGTGTTRRATVGAIDNWISFFDTNYRVSPAGSDSLVVNISTSSIISVLATSVEPPLAGATFTPTMMSF